MHTLLLGIEVKQFVISRLKQYSFSGASYPGMSVNLDVRAAALEHK